MAKSLARARSMPGYWNLDRHRLAALEPGAVDLPQGGRRERLALPGGEGLLGRPAQLVAELDAGEGAVHGRRLPLELGQTADVGLGQGVRLLGEDLAHLEERPFEPPHGVEDLERVRLAGSGVDRLPCCRTGARLAGLGESGPGQDARPGQPGAGEAPARAGRDLRRRPLPAHRASPPGAGRRE